MLGNFKFLKYISYLLFFRGDDPSYILKTQQKGWQILHVSSAYCVVIMLKFGKLLKQLYCF